MNMVVVYLYGGTHSHHHFPLQLLFFRRMEEEEEKEGLTKRGMEGFHSNLLTRNIAMGADAAINAKSAYTVGMYV